MTRPRWLSMFLVAGMAASASAQKDQAPAASELDSTEGFVAFPIVAFLPEAGLIGGGYGIYYFDLDVHPLRTAPSSLQMLAVATTEGQLGLELSPEVFVARRTYWFLGELTGRLDPEAAFFGIGNETRSADEESYQQKAFEAEVEGRRRLVGDLYGGLVIRYDLRTVDSPEPGGLLDTLRPVGHDGGWVAGVGPSLAWDVRDQVFAPRSGSLVTARALFYGAPLGSEFGFTRLALDARHFIDLGADHVLALQATGELIVGDAPFDRLAKLGGAEMLRGYINGRFRDDGLAALQVEWRFPIHWRFRGAVFLAAGQVTGESALSPDAAHVAGGVGLRFVLVESRRINVRLDAAASPETVRPYFAPLEAF